MIAAGRELVALWIIGTPGLIETDLVAHASLLCADGSCGAVAPQTISCGF